MADLWKTISFGSKANFEKYNNDITTTVLQENVVVVATGIASSFWALAVLTIDRP